MENKEKQGQNLIESILRLEPFVLNSEQKSKLFIEAMNAAFRHHMENNELFRNYCKNFGFTVGCSPVALSDYPYIPVNILKNQRLTSVHGNRITAILSSSAT